MPIYGASGRPTTESPLHSGASMIGALANRPLYVLAVRHGHVVDGDHRLWGRTHGIGLTDQGIEEALALSAAMSRIPLDAIYSSPRDRSWQTAHVIAQHHRVPVTAITAFDEMDCGAWTGKRFEELQEDPQWRAYNDSRETATVPEGESAPMLRRRVTRGLTLIEQAHLGGTVLIVTHVEVIRAIVLDALGWSADLWASVRVDPASTSSVVRREGATAVHAINLSTRALRFWTAPPQQRLRVRNQHPLPRAY
jgi:ribonuclease H / adenosylcobalamin/alpha-ribazole phosphatase